MLLYNRLFSFSLNTSHQHEIKFIVRLRQDPEFGIVLFNAMLLSNAYLAFNGFDCKDTVSIDESLRNASDGSFSIIASTPSSISC